MLISPLTLTEVESTLQRRLRQREIDRELGVPLITLDAVHLACAQSYGCERVATGDRQFARAVERCRLAVHEFSE